MPFVRQPKCTSIGLEDKPILGNGWGLGLDGQFMRSINAVAAYTKLRHLYESSPSCGGLLLLGVDDLFTPVWLAGFSG